MSSHQEPEVPASVQIAFIGGLHRSGTSLLQQCLRQHPDVSGMTGTGAPEDEGQHLQTVYPTALSLGGPGRFGFSPMGHLTEESPLVSAANRQRLWQEWARFWDLNRKLLLEKSPPNLIRSRFLDALFPGSRFVMLVRHPVAVVEATAARTPRPVNVASLIEHWVRCHELLRLDASRLDRLLIVPYEAFVADPRRWFDRLYAFLGCPLERPSIDIRPDLNDRYFATFGERLEHRLRGRSLRRTCAELEERVRACGYSLEDRELVRPDEELVR